MKTRKLFIAMLVFVLAFGLVGTAAAQEEDPPPDEGTEETCANPIASLFDAYFSADTGEGRASGIVDEITETSITVDGVTYLINEDTLMAEGVVAGDEVTVDYITDENEDLVATNVEFSSEDPEETEETISVCDQVTEYHEDGMGWGVLTKLYAIAAESLENCDGEAECGVSVEELVDMFSSGTGMGQLFKEYGKPSMLGVGHLRKAVECQDEDGDTDGLETASSDSDGNGNGNGKGKGKGKSNNGKGKGNNGGDGGGDVDTSSDSGGNGNGKGKNKGKGNENANVNSNGNAGGTDEGNLTNPADDDDEDTGDGEDTDDGDDTDDGEDTDDDDNEEEKKDKCGGDDEDGDEDEGEVNEED